MPAIRRESRVVVSGAGGLIGRTVVRLLAAEGHDVVAIHRSGIPAGFESFGSWLELDLMADNAAASIPATNPDVLVHTAAVLPETFDGDSARRAAATNRSMDQLVLEAAGCRIVYFSSVSVYGFGSGPFSEDGPLNPSGPYAEAKLATEQQLAEEDDNTILRVSAAYGSGQVARTVLRLFIQQALSGQDLRYHGSGARCQDFVAAPDVAAAVAAAVSTPAVRGVLNIASGNPISMADLARLVVRETGSSSSVGPSTSPDPQEDHRARYDTRRIAASVDGWPATDLADGIRRLASQAT